MARYAVGWVDLAVDQYLALSPAHQRLVDARVRQLLDEPGVHSSYDARTDLWTTTDDAGAGLIAFTFRTDRPRLIILRLIY